MLRALAILLLLLPRAFAGELYESELQKKRLLYSIDEQHDTLEISAEATRTSLDMQKIRLAYDEGVLQRVESLAPSGSVPPANVYGARAVVKGDKINILALEKTLQMQEAKLASLEALHDGRLLDFLVADRDRNVAQLAACRYTLESMKVNAKYSEDVTQKLEELVRIGSVPPPAFILEHTEALLWARNVIGQERTCRLDEKQLQMAETELARVRKLFLQSASRGQENSR